MGNGTLADVGAWGEDGHALTVFRVTPYVAFYTTSVLREVAPHQCVIGAMGIVVEELGAQLGLGVRCLGYDQQTAGVFVNTVHQSYTWVVRVVAGQIAQVPGNSVDQCAVEVAHSGVYHQSGRLVDNHQLVILIDHVQGDVLWFYRRVIVRTVEHQRDDVARTYLVVALDGCSVYLDETSIGSFLDTVARGVLHMFRHVFVDAYRLLSTVYLHAQVLIQLTFFGLV